ncbi:MAG: hypothetical protein KBS47_03705 [Bacteroidales bacterium]|nr:hypothetical protein [Candidatus Equimonas enterica]
MTVCEQLKEHLTHEGFCPEETEFGLAFKYQMAGFLHLKDDNDAHFFSLCFPAIMKADEAHLTDVFKAMNLANSMTKFANARILNDDEVWVFFETYIPDEPNWNEIVPLALNTMMFYRDRFYQAFTALINPQKEEAPAKEEK